MRLVFGDRATENWLGQPIPVGEIVESAAKEWFRRHLRFVDVDRHLVLQNAIHSGSVELSGTLMRKIPAANDTSAAVGYAPLSETERIVIAGFGARHAEMVALAERLEVRETVRFLPYQRRERLPFSLSSADIHVVGLAKGLAGYVVPSRLYGVLAAGRPVLVAADDTSETARLVREIGCGIVIPPARPELIARTIREAADGAFDLSEMGRRGRVYVEEEADRLVAMERYRALVREMLAGANFQVDQAMTGAEGLRQARALQPDAILLDVNLPDMSGFDVYRALRADPATAALPVVILSSQRVLPEAVALDAGIQVLAKSQLTRDSLRTALRQAAASAA